MTWAVNQTEMWEILGARISTVISHHISLSLSLSLSLCHTRQLCNTSQVLFGHDGRIVSVSACFVASYSWDLIFRSPFSQWVSTYWVFKAWQKTQIKMSILLPWGGIFSRAMAIKCNCWFILPRRLGNFYCYWQELCPTKTTFHFNINWGEPGQSRVMERVQPVRHGQHLAQSVVDKTEEGKYLPGVQMPLGRHKK